MPLILQKGKNFQEIKELVLRSNISPADQAELIDAFAKANEADLKEVLKLFSEDNSWIMKISENYKSKRSAFASGDKTAWQDILREEENQLKELKG
jgi:hypothetical protein